ncbi:MAG: hypothetical protein A3D24_04000 [Candidatus Blackburnbacteria bacterium RIFCSPHIGHO2_02_FULL_39_13]|uniref:Aspartyl/glutamyl-tRNA(Asn/Gln) amidotransferase subunit B n=1 Tax=Candidatus Blackburnbacteria bacterium RIFCSPLOWO2_01_FULL_40_20 TaxID=1797519 RepID=A0A1G1VCQ7_9BACT|nr:MAG: Aspartyl/glutamyl-tRNA(Asn/Gln) amidotransferase subunit B [Microgenomates group bacterium GW2011_GWA2_39_19]OGY06964.1 MAG: hypothetical protein A2694_02495 [Candidatus Blackburnbacteria bacterium RIFCSPHIGHO2_01_FULL_40_17]OGY09631.1 MAG: hypothetical protein A3D24_04000 [Candidatus Blackburnbacteria bacterium RIFCSPHIGHO2_02_FULL_39_13]OGY13220.1 MAG: hypothetical protein A3A77_01445 [Candidatus Blackburnbacteria bacterium RIFCSPLOWO2_01_FULL_40_20]HBL52374.1 Asp-tRNA(Asn)/Glu-tRNA(G
MKYQPIIGMEVHIELRTKTKMFCACPGFHFGTKPNTQTCPVCLGLPGALPVPNAQAVEWTQFLGTAFGCTLAKFSRFDRKNYFYPDLPKGYQISQYEYPLATYGSWTNGEGKKIGIRRIHLEEDTGKLSHTTINGERVTLVDFNRSGVPLAELVTEPDFSSSAEAKEFVQALQQIVRYLEISDADMEKGSMRLEANISVRVGQTTNDIRQKLPDYRVEVKNINSFRFLESAINYEIERQSEALERGEKLVQETRGYNEVKGITFSQRQKEEAHDYRYFPEPDIPSFEFSDEILKEIKSKLPELPESKRKRFETEYKISPSYSKILTETRELADFFEEAIKVGSVHGISPAKLANTLVNKKPNISKMLPAELIKLIKNAEEKGQISDEELEKVSLQSIEENSDVVESYKNGKESVLQFLVGQVMRKTKGRADPTKTAELLKKLLS